MINYKASNCPTSDSMQSCKSGSCLLGSSTPRMSVPGRPAAPGRIARIALGHTLWLHWAHYSMLVSVWVCGGHVWVQCCGPGLGGGYGVGEHFSVRQVQAFLNIPTMALALALAPWSVGFTLGVTSTPRITRPSHPVWRTVLPRPPFLPPLSFHLSISLSICLSI